MPGRTRRINRGGGHSYELDGEPTDGVTGIIGDGVPKPALIGWASNVTAGYAIDHWDELAAMTPSRRLEQLKKARSKTSGEASVRGTQVHDLAESLARGEEVTVPDHLIGYVDAYLDFVEAWAPDELFVEAPIINRQWRFMGTLDLLARIAEETWLIDYKTAGSGIWPETALQLSAYARAETILDAGGHEQPMPQVDRAAALWLHADGYDLIPVDISEATFRVFLYAQQVAHFTRAQRAEFVFDALPPPDAERRLEVVR